MGSVEFIFILNSFQETVQTETMTSRAAVLMVGLAKTVRQIVTNVLGNHVEIMAHVMTA